MHSVLISMHHILLKDIEKDFLGGILSLQLGPPELIFSNDFKLKRLG